MEMLNIKKLNEVEDKEKYQVEVSDKSATLENLSTEVEINSAREMIRENIKVSGKESLGFYGMKKHMPWFNEGYSKLLDERKQAKLQWLQDPSEINGDNLNNVRCEASIHLRRRKREYLKNKNNELTANSKNKNTRDPYRRINEFKGCYQPRNNNAG
jgi:hypothetical protein